MEHHYGTWIVYGLLLSMFLVTAVPDYVLSVARFSEFEECLSLVASGL